MQTIPRGKFIIINMENFLRQLEILSYRLKGADKVVEGLQKLLLELRLIVKRYDNPATSEIEDALRSAAKEDYSHFNRCVCVCVCVQF